MNPQSLEGLRLLVIDDDAAMTFLLSEFLQSYGAEVIAVNTIKQGKVVLERQQIDCLLSDLSMPDGNGYKLISEWRQQEIERQQPRLPAILLTGHVKQLDQQEAQRAGFDRHLSKPFQPTALVELILSLIGEGLV